MSIRWRFRSKPSRSRGVCSRPPGSSPPGREGPSAEGLLALTRDQDGVLYTPLARLARGSFASPILAYEHIDESRRPVVVKRLPARNRAFRRAFAEELLQGLECGVHKNLVRCRRLARDDQGLFAVHGWVPGLDLGQVLRRAAERDVHVPLAVAVAVGRQLAEALRFLHRQRHHGSISPSNVLLRLDGRLKLQLPDGPREPDRDALRSEDMLFLPRRRLDPRGPSKASDLRAVGELLCEVVGLSTDSLLELQSRSPTLAWALERCLGHEQSEQLRGASELSWALDNAAEEVGPRDDEACLTALLEELDVPNARDRVRKLDNSRSRAS